jgi:EPS-associated MarR family transcriptional regulator
MPHAISDEVRYRLLKCLADKPGASQRQLAEELGVSLGKLNYCLRAFIDKGLVKARNFRNSDNKLGYAYILTPQGLEEKITVTRSFLSRKVAEYELLVEEIEKLTAEAGESAYQPNIE